jgi:DNA-directed RNA polymerase subunit E'/Rpb7
MIKALIKRTVALPSEMLNSEVFSHLLDIVRKEFEGKCTKDDGIITKIISIEKILDNYISPATSNINFVLSLNVETLKPQIGDIFTETVKQITVRGIFISSSITVIIPAHTLTEYTYDRDSEKFVGDGKMISVDDTINISITAIKYENNKFKYIGCLV